MSDYIEAPLFGVADAHTIAVVSAVDEDYRREADRDRIDDTIRRVAMRDGGEVDPGRVRAELTNEHGLTVNPRSLSARYMALSRAGVLRFDHWTVSDDTTGRNSGKPARVYRYVA